MRSRITRAVKENHYPIIGKLKCGMKGEKFPKSVDYFIATGKYAPTFESKFGEKPNSIAIAFLEDDSKGQCEERWEYRDASGALYAYGDGEIFNVYNGKSYDPYLKMEHEDIMDRIHAKVKAKGWFVTLTLRFIIPELPILGVWQLTTKGAASSIPNITGIFDAVLEQNGSVKGVLFDLNVSFAKSQKPNDSSRFPVIELVPNHTPERIRQVTEAMQSNKLNQGLLS